MPIDAMRPIYLPKRQIMESDEDYDTGIVQNEENLNQNFNRLYSGVADILKENESLKARLARLEAMSK